MVTFTEPLVLWFSQIYVVDSSLSLAHSCYGSPPLKMMARVDPENVDLGDLLIANIYFILCIFCIVDLILPLCLWIYHWMASLAVILSTSIHK